MRFKKTIVFSSIILIVLLIYTFFANRQEYYVSLGDSLAVGINPYGIKDYGYTDYLKNDLQSSKRLKTYVDFTQKESTMDDLLDLLRDNEEVIMNGHKYNIRSSLRESTLVTISIGAQDFFKAIDQNNISFNNIKPYKEIVAKLRPRLAKTIKEIRKYAKGEVIIIGYYNPTPFLFNTNSSQLDELYAYIDDIYQKIAQDNQAKYVSTYQLFKSNPSFLPNPDSIFPTKQGYQAIFEEIKAILTKKA